MQEIDSGPATNKRRESAPDPKLILANKLPLVLLKDADCVQFLQSVCPQLRMRWPGFRKVRRQVCKRVDRRLKELGLASIASYSSYLAKTQIIFFKDKRAFDEFTRGNFEFGAQAEAVAITAGASAGAFTTGNSATASGGMNNAITRGGYHKGTAVFTVTKGGLMYEASIGGQKFKYTAK